MATYNSPLTVNGMTLHNRLVFPPMRSGKANPEGAATDELIAYYRDRARGGYFGLMIVEHNFITPAGRASQTQMSIASDAMVDGHKRLVDAIHGEGAKAVLQLNHAGSHKNYDTSDEDVIGPSAVAHPTSKIVPRAMTKDDMRGVIDAWCLAARRALEAGYDGVEVHSAHGYLLNQFFSPITNTRDDEYGGSAQNRARLHGEVIRAVRAVIGADVPLFVRLGGSDYMDGGITFGDSEIAAPLLREAGADLIDVSGGLCGYDLKSPDEGYFAPLSKLVREVSGLPVILTGGIRTPQGADAFLDDGSCDLIGIGRPVLKDAGWMAETFPR